MVLGADCGMELLAGLLLRGHWVTQHLVRRLRGANGSRSGLDYPVLSFARPCSGNWISCASSCPTR